MSELEKMGNEIYKNKLKIYKEKFKKNKSSSQINFLGDAEFWSVLSTYKTLNDETQKSLIQRAVYKLVTEEMPHWFEDLKIEEPK